MIFEEVAARPRFVIRICLLPAMRSLARKLLEVSWPENMALGKQHTFFPFL